MRTRANIALTKAKVGGQYATTVIAKTVAARAGYDPRSGITLWNKMAAASKGAPPEWLSTHPSGDSRIKDIEAALPPPSTAESKPLQLDARQLLVVHGGNVSAAARRSAPAHASCSVSPASCCSWWFS